MQICAYVPHTHPKSCPPRICTRDYPCFTASPRRLMFLGAAVLELGLGFPIHYRKVRGPQAHHKCQVSTSCLCKLSKVNVGPTSPLCLRGDVCNIWPRHLWQLFSVPLIRSKKNPEGNGKPDVEAANFLVCRVMLIAMLCAAKGCWVVIEQPASSIMSLSSCA
jgi:hypothetical protein